MKIVASRICKEPALRKFAREFTDNRNGFDHAWASKNGDLAEIGGKGF
jgi:hypothetical protein